MSVKNVLMGLYAQASDNPDIDLSDANATGNDVLVGKTFFAGNTQLKSGTMPTLAETIYSPSNEQQIIPSGRYLQGNQIIEPVTLSTKNITENGTYSASSDGVLGYDTLNVNVPSSATEPYIEETYNASGDLTNAVLHGYTKIRGYMFYNCYNLISATLSNTIINIGEYAFSSCYYLSSTVLPENITSIERYTFKDCIRLNLLSLPSNLTTIKYHAFNGCKALALTTLPNSIISIETNAFYNCSNLALTALPSGLTKIENSAFYNCSNLALTALPSGLTKIEYRAFGYCTNLNTLTFAGTPTMIDSGAFYGCTNLLTINVPWSQGAVANAPWGATASTIVYDYVGA